MSEASFWMPEMLTRSAWLSHAPFAFWLMEVHRPTLLVELGVHSGFSYFVFNQALKDLQAKARCFGLDTWKGDEHAGIYGNQVFEQVSAYNDAHYADFSELIRSTFDDAVASFGDGTIDLLHIDGRHFYEDVQHDFETWKPKLSSRAIVLFHDTNVRSRDFGVYKLWEELGAQYRQFEFFQGHGLGVLAVGAEIPEQVSDLLGASANAELANRIRIAYSRLGAAIVDRTTVAGGMLGDPYTQLQSQRRELDEMYGRLRRDHDELNTLHTDLGNRFASCVSEHHKLNGECEQLRSEHLALQSLYADVNDRLQTSEDTRLQLSSEIGRLPRVTKELESVQREHEQLKAAYQSLQQEHEDSGIQVKRLRREIIEKEKLLEDSSRLMSELRTSEAASRKELTNCSAELNRLLASSSWRFTSAPRKMMSKAPRLRSFMLNALRVLWWTLSLQLGRRIRTERLVKFLASSRLFDREYYLESNPDVAKSGAEPTRHYLQRGAAEGRNPHPLFDTNYYLQQYPDVAGAEINPLVHYLSKGWKENRLPHPLIRFSSALREGRATTEPLEVYIEGERDSGLTEHPLFDADWYLDQNLDVKESGGNPLMHYLRYGWKENRNPHPLFDSAWFQQTYSHKKNPSGEPLTEYLLHGWMNGAAPHLLFDPSFYVEQNTDVASLGAEPLEHYLVHGASEGRNPHPLFESSWYSLKNPAMKAGKNPLIHYLQDGAKAQCDPHPLFETKFYLDQGPHVSGTEPKAIRHFLTRGGLEGFDPSPLFDSSWYLEQNPDVVRAGLNPLVHFLTRGWLEKRNPNPYFDVTFYLQSSLDALMRASDPLSDYLLFGAEEGKNPHVLFDTRWYLHRYTDIEASGLNPLYHYLKWGRLEGRIGRSVLAAERDKKRRIAFISGESHTPGHRYRVLDIVDALAPRFFQTEVFTSTEVVKHLRAISNADLIWIWRATWSPAISDLINAAHGRGAKVLFDIDDLMFRPELAKIELIDGIRSQDLSEAEIQAMYSQVQAVLANADHCTVPTKSLAIEIRGLLKPATVIPNGFNRATLELARLLRSERRDVEADNRIRIGYASGSKTHQRDLAVASRAIARVLADNPSALLVLFRRTIDISEFPELQRVSQQIEWRDLVPIDKLPSEYARFNINLAPLEVGNPFCEAKSELKYFEAALVGVPTIASPTQPFVDAIRHGETGFLANDEDDWQALLDQLIQNPQLGRNVADKAYAEVIWLYGPERRALLVNKLISLLLAPEPTRSHLFVLQTNDANKPSTPAIEIAPYDVLYESKRTGFSRVSVVIPLYNYEKLLREALDSVRQQSIRAIDLIVVDDQSTDNSLEIAKAWLQDQGHVFNFVALLQNKVNSKLGRTRNTAISYSETELYLPLDPDNLLLPDCVEKSIALLDDTGAAYAYPTIQMFGSADGKMGHTEFNPSLFQSGNYIDAMAMVRKACWAAVGGYGDLNPAGWEDYDFWCKLTEQGLFGARVQDVVAKYRVHESSMLHTTTNVSQNRRLVVEDLNLRHPWLALPCPSIGHNPQISSESVEQPSLAAALQGAGDLTSLKKLVSLLRCPETGEHLVLERGKLISELSKREWPVVRGRPVFTDLGKDVPVQPEFHTSNALPEDAVRLIKACSGLVLNLSAGASAVRFGNVIELEYSIFKNTDVVGDVHRLPFRNEVFDAVVCLNAFEHYREPDLAAEEIRRILKPGGRVFIHTAFLQPLHEAPHHYYDCTEFGLRQWLRNLNIDEIRVSDNFNPIYGLSWLLSEIDFGFINAGQTESSRVFRGATIGETLALWRNPHDRRSTLWKIFQEMPHETQKQFAAGWQATASK